MAKLTLSFKDRKLKVIPVHGLDILVGRDPECTICIDSLAIEPQHARICDRDGIFTLEPVSSNTPVQINDDPVEDPVNLSEGDRISIGKHNLVFSFENEGTPVQDKVVQLPVTGWLQIQSGTHLGRTIRLDKAFTRIGKPEAGLAIIARRDNGYYISCLQGTQYIRVADQPVDEQVRKLQDEDSIRVGELQVQFFLDASEARQAEPEDANEDHRRQRSYSRVMFDVNARLQDDSRQWTVRLVDISLHGALVRSDEVIHTDGGTLMLSIQLENGPSICMDVQIAHREGRQTGLRCTDIDVESITCLRRLLELNSGDPDSIQRELSALG